MKKISVITIATIVFFSCNKLGEDPDSIITSSQFYKTQSDAITAVNAVYSTLNTDAASDFPIYGRDLNLLTGNGSDDQIYSPSNTNPDVRALGTTTYVASNDRVKKNWQQHYLWSGAPLVLHDPASTEINATKIKRSPKDSMYIQIIKRFN